MKTKIILSFLSMSIALAAAGQSLPNDDIYFSKKDRVKLEAARASESSSSYMFPPERARRISLKTSLPVNLPTAILQPTILPVKPTRNLLHAKMRKPLLTTEKHFRERL